MASLAARLQTIIAFGLVEKAEGRIYDTCVFVGPQGYLYHYRKTWLWYDKTDVSFRDEWARLIRARGRNSSTSTAFAPPVSSAPTAIPGAVLSGPRPCSRRWFGFHQPCQGFII